MNENVKSHPVRTIAPGPRAVVAIPVRNEAERIVACLDALAGQVGLAPDDFGIVLFLNNCTDDTAGVIASRSLPWPIRVIEQNDPDASAGWARRIAMNAAAAWLAERHASDGVLLTSDADSRVASDWVARNLAAIAAGADLVAGRISLDPIDAAALPERLHARGRLEARYEALLIEIEARLDPDPGNPWPCHWAKSGATLCVRHAVYEAVGGMPDRATGEDRAFVDVVRAHDFVVRHDCAIEVVTSGRLVGRATGGVADTIKHRCDMPDSACDDRLEGFPRAFARILWRRRLRRLFVRRQLAATWRWAPALAIPTSVAKTIATSTTFGSAHAAIEAHSPRLAYKPVGPRTLPQEIFRAAWLLRVLRTFEHRRAPRNVRAEPGNVLQVVQPP